MNVEKAQPAQILLVEDSPSDVRLTEEALRDARIANELHVAVDGVEAIEFLRQRGKHADAPRPDLVLLDLDLPKKNGREVLAEIKDDPELKSMPVIVLTTSREEEDILDSYKLHANSFVSKPLDLDEFLAAVRGLEDYWLSIVKLPPARPGTI